VGFVLRIGVTIFYEVFQMLPRTNASTGLRNSGLVEKLINSRYINLAVTFLWQGILVRLCAAYGRVCSRGVSCGVLTQAVGLEEF